MRLKPILRIPFSKIFLEITFFQAHVTAILITSLFVVKIKTLILFGINIVSSNFVVDRFYMNNRRPQKLLAIHISSVCLS